MEVDRLMELGEVIGRYPSALHFAHEPLVVEESVLREGLCTRVVHQPRVLVPEGENTRGFDTDERCIGCYERCEETYIAFGILGGET